ncbi:hypothetical protein D9M72_633110 [compost metagenome]
MHAGFDDVGEVDGAQDVRDVVLSDLGDQQRCSALGRDFFDPVLYLGRGVPA